MMAIIWKTLQLLMLARQFLCFQNCVLLQGLMEVTNMRATLAFLCMLLRALAMTEQKQYDATQCSIRASNT